jgi:hypothetical protein
VNDIIEAMEDKNLFGSLFKDPATWAAWRVYLRALFGIPILEKEDRKVFRECTGLKQPPKQRIRESFLICGRRSGKSFILSLAAVYLACFKEWQSYLGPGETGRIFIVAVDRRQATVIKNYISGILAAVPMLRTLVENETSDSIRLKNKVCIEIKTANFRGLRGFTLLAALLDELAYFYSENSASPDREIIASLRPALATIPESVLVGLSSPYSRSGILYQQHQAYFGKPGSTLIWKAPTVVMNPTIDRELIRKAMEDDREAALSDWESEWRQDISSFLPVEMIQNVVIPGRFEIPYIDDRRFFGHIDPSGGRGDSFCLAVTSRDPNGKIILHAVRERKPPFQPEGVVSEFAAVLKAYKITTVESDAYAGTWPVEQFAKQGITVKMCDKNSSELYLELLPIVSQGSLEVLDHKRLISQLAGLTRRTRPGGRDLITHFPGSHDDLAVVLAGATYQASRKQIERHIYWLSDGDDNPGGWERRFGT